ncbi:MAG: DUF2332 family protein [Micrococcales bacterium]|nr:DUF2332 family protein [Micrococcales bacterium]
MRPHPDPTAEWYRRAARELAPHSALHKEWSAAIAADAEVLTLIDRLPRAHRQPSLVLCSAAFAGAPTASGWAGLRAWLLERWPEIERVAAARTTQTNEPGRRGPLAVALARIPGPVALLELGAAAGLCLLPDRSRIRFVRGGASRTLGSGAPELGCGVTGSGALPERMPEIIWRRGLDLAPLSVLEDGDVRWLEALVPPDRPDRLRRLREAVAAARAEPPRVVRADALAGLRAALAEIPDGAVPVVASLGTAVYLPPADRTRLLSEIRACGARAITFEAEAALPEVAAALGQLTAPEPHPFVLALDGMPIARCSAHGERVSLLGRPSGPA